MFNRMATLIDFEPYILNDVNMDNYLKYKLKQDISINTDKNTNQNTKQKQQEKQSQTLNNDKLFIPRGVDSLFWCYYIMLNGDVKYEMLLNRNLLTEKQMKIDLVSKIRENKSILKTYKFDTLANIESNLVNDNTMNIKTFMSLCAIDKINVIYVNKKSYFEFLMTDDGITYIVRDVEKSRYNNKYNNKYGYEIGDKNSLEYVRTNLYQMESIDKPIKGLSSYKVQDLIEIADKLAINIINSETGKKRTKTELYESISQLLLN